MLKDLEDLGLTEKEAKVYLAALEIGRATADQLAKHAKIVRPTAYVQIKSLMDKGLMSTYEEGKKTYFAAESPEVLRRVLDQQKESIQSKFGELDRLLPGLKQMFDTAGERPVVRFFPGKEGLMAVREEMLKTKDKETFVIFSPARFSKHFNDAYLNDYSDRRKALGIHSKGIYVEGEMFDRAGIDHLTERRSLASKKLNLSVDIYIFDSKVAIISLEGSLFGMVVQSEQFYNSMKSLFSFLWEQAEQGPQ